MRGPCSPLVAALALVAGCTCEEREPLPAASTSVAPSASAPPRARTPLADPLLVEERTANGRRYLELRQKPFRLEARFTRPTRGDANIALAVAGTYTSPAGSVEGVVVDRGRVVSRDAKPWQGLLVITKDAIAIEKRAAPPDPDALAKDGATALQGHLLVYENRAEKLKPSPKQLRRALGIHANGELAFVESRLPQTLPGFADDLVALGFERALNLDMGAWSEGFYRHRGGIHALGDDTSATEKQTNWLVLTSH
jgi:hypothetical protein